MAGTVALVVAAGRGQRFGGDRPKQYELLAGRPLLAWSLAAFARHPSVTAVRAVIHPDDRPLYADAAAGLDLLDPVHGGAERQESVLRGLESLVPLNPERVLIHDGARPNPGSAVIDAVIAALRSHIGAIPALPVTDTLKRGSAGTIAGTASRDGLFRAQTPQGFRFAEILAAHRRVAATAGSAAALTDDAAVAEAAGHAVALVPGLEENVKVTTREDLSRVQRALLGVEEVRVGNGYDVHRFGSGDRVWLCGVPVPHEHGLVGHSDADVGIHALVDAILGAIGKGDIGEHFPPSDERWRGAPSRLFLEEACRLVNAKGGRLVNLDVTLICERPKLSPHRLAMRQRLSELTGLSLDRVSVKATTTEGLGFTGRQEGIAAQATATVALPVG
jgi:2-C-methyl-D-erythritol 4-phosphate cytidylyltransferase / 2-C-methyl-D-erythritol 2,4-cyclodiphosphate synthase